MPSEQCVYWEEQRESLCAVHALNSLVQQPMFQEVELAEIAQELDAQEAALLGRKRRKGAASHNVSTSGDFSVQVLAAALRRKGLELALGRCCAKLESCSNRTQGGIGGLCGRCGGSGMAFAAFL